MIIILELLLLLVLGVLFCQDIKERKVAVWVLVLGILLGGFIHSFFHDKYVFLLTIFMNSLFILFVFTILWGYARLKMKKKIFEVFGLGDLLFFMLLAVSLPTLSFLMVFVFSLIFSLLIFLFLKNRFKNQTVPLAGLQSLFLVLVLITNKFFNFINIYAI